MANNLLETDKALEALLLELKALKSTSEQLQDAGRNASQVIQSAEQVTALSAQVMDNGTRQTEALRKLATTTEDRIGEAIAAQKSFADEIEDFLRTELRPQLEQQRQAVGRNRWLLVVVLFLTLANTGILAWLVQLQLSR